MTITKTFDENTSMPLKLDFINVTTGVVTPGAVIVFPKLTSHCSDGVWDIEPHNGATSTVFFLN